VGVHELLRTSAALDKLGAMIVTGWLATLRERIILKD
jgi:hypothetical protein